MAGTEAFNLSPPAANDLDAAEAAWHDTRIRKDLPAGATWWRALRADSAVDARKFAATTFPSPNNNRFSPVRDAGGSRIVPAAYAGSTPEVALWELVLRRVRHEGIRRVPRHETRDRWLIEVRLAREFHLLNVTKPGDNNLVSAGKRPPELSRAWPSAYNATRRWAQELYARIPEIDGLYYESHQLAAYCLVLYQDVHPPAFAVVGKPVRVEDEPVRSILEREATQAGAVVDWGDPDP